jgi:FMN phosphatase YigB (HAD superfamily)
MAFRAVLFDWRGTLVVAPTFEQWAGESLRRLGRPSDEAAASELAARLADAADDLDAPGVDSDAAEHCHTYHRVLAELGLDPDLVGALYEVESDLTCNVFAHDAAETLGGLKDAGLGIAVVSDIHVDLRPAFAVAGLADCIDVFTLSFEQGAQKPDPRMFLGTLDALGVQPSDALMVGDRSAPDGGAVEVGLATLLLPPLTHPGDRRLHLVSTLCGAPPRDISHTRYPARRDEHPGRFPPGN